MKKLALTIAIILGMSIAASAQNGGGLFGYGSNDNETENTRGAMRGGNPGLPGHGETGDQNAPLGSGALLLIGFGAAYALKKRNK